MKNKGQIWYIGYIVSLFLIVIILVTDFPKMVDLGLAILFSVVFGVSHVQILHEAGNITNMFNTILLGVATVIFICLDYIIPAIIVGSIIAIQPIILIIISSVLEKKM